jgi:hypothetical protein
MGVVNVPNADMVMYLLLKRSTISAIQMDRIFGC